MDALYKHEGNIAFPSEWTSGPWNPSFQHGAAPSALAVWAAEQLSTTAPMRTARVTIDLIRPVPVEPLDLQTRVIRDGRKIQLCEVVLLTNAVEVVRAIVLKTLIGSNQFDKPVQALDLPLPSEGASTTTRRRSSFSSIVCMRTVKGGIHENGPAAIWLRINRPIVSGSPNSPAMRAAVAADFCNGVSAVLPFDQWTYVNGDLSINLVRDPVGEWILLDAETWLSSSGGGLALGRLGDTTGYFGRTAQSLVVERRENST